MRQTVINSLVFFPVNFLWFWKWLMDLFTTYSGGGEEKRKYPKVPLQPLPLHRSLSQGKLLSWIYSTACSTHGVYTDSSYVDSEEAKGHCRGADASAIFLLELAATLWRVLVFWLQPCPTQARTLNYLTRSQNFSGLFQPRDENLVALPCWEGQQH